MDPLSPPPQGRQLLRQGRRLLRLAALSLVTLLLGPPAKVSSHLPKPLAPWGRRYRRWAFRTWCRACLRIAGVRVDRVGQPPLPPFFLVANHLSYLDIFVLGADLPDAVFVAKHEVAGWPMVGMLARSVETIFINRADLPDLMRVNGEVEAALDRGRSVVMFPEGTSTPGLRVERFMSPVLDPPARRAMPVHAATLHYRTGPGDPPAVWSVCWWGAMTFAPHVLGFLLLDGVDASLSYTDQPTEGSDRKALARGLQAQVEAAFAPIVSGEDACRIPWP